MKWRVVLLSLLFTLLIIHFGMCQKDEPEVKSKDEKRRNVKPKPVKAPRKPLSAKTKRKSTPENPKEEQTSLTQVLQKGKFRKVGETLTVGAAETLELRCKGNPVQWTVPEYLLEDHEGRLSGTGRGGQKTERVLRLKPGGCGLKRERCHPGAIPESRLCDIHGMVQHERYGTLIVANSTAADTGEYTCFPVYCEEKDCRKIYDKAVKVYIFFSDPQELFVPSSDYYEVLQLRTNWPAILPCRVTSPLATVTLHREFPPAEVKVDGREISFNAQKGFTIHRPQQQHSGSLYCVASLGNLRQSSTKYMLIYVNYPAAPPSPALQASSESVAVGQNLQVSCTVIGEQDVLVEFTWEYPGQKIGRPLYTQDSVQIVQLDGQNRQRTQSVLLVDEVREVDQGIYTCTAQNLQGSRTASTSVKVQNTQTSNRPAEA